MFQTAISNKCKEGLKWAKRHGLNLDELFAVVDMLQRQEVSPARYRDYALTMDRAGLRNYHIRPDWVLIYEIREAEPVLLLVKTDSHPDLRM